MKIIGAVLVLVSGGALGIQQTVYYDKVLFNIKQLFQITVWLIRQITTERATLPEAVLAVSNRQKDEFGEVLKTIAKELYQNNGKDLSIIWRTYFEESDLCVPTEIRNCFIHLFDQIGFYDQNSQLQQLEVAKELMGQTIQKMEKERAEKCKLYQSIGVFAGLFMIILLW